MKSIPLLTLSVHAADVHYDADQAEAAFQEVRALNANGVRTDVCWYDIEPRFGAWDEERLRWYQGYFERARQHNLSVICVLYGLPMWIRVLSWVRPHAFLERWRLYCQRVESVLGDSVSVVQVWNEVNHPYYQWVSRRLVPNLVRIARETLAAKRELAINVYDGFGWWQSYITGLLAEAGGWIDIIGIDSFPETYRVSNGRSWNPLEILLRRVNDPTDTWYGKKAALLETGFSTYIPLLKTAARQANWIRDNFDAIGRLNDTFSNSLSILNWYKLFNAHGEVPLNVLGHFGVVGTIRKDRQIRRKHPAYDRLAEHFDALRI